MKTWRRFNLFKLTCLINGIILSTPVLAHTSSATPFIGLGVGYFFDIHGQYYPLVAVSNDSGVTWTYPSNIFRDLAKNIDPTATTGTFQGGSCTGSGEKTVCISAGVWCSGSFCSVAHPAIAVGTKNGTEWKYPPSVFQNLNTIVDPNLTNAALVGNACFGSGTESVCMAAGHYGTSTITFPLLTLSSDGGQNWTYPTTIFKNLTTTIDPGFNGGNLSTVSCTPNTINNICVTAGNFCNDTSCKYTQPLLAFSIDKGNTWAYPASVFENLTTQIDPNYVGGYLTSSSCSGSDTRSLCIAVGSYSNNMEPFPLLTMSQDGGNTWAYPPAIFQNFATNIGHNAVGGFFTAASCSGTSKNSVCIAAGSYTTADGSVPILAQTRNGGNTWEYPTFIYTKLKTVVDPQFTRGQFQGASCIDNDKSTICIAAGTYCNGPATCYPLIALTQDGGKTWSYPPSVFQHITTVIDPDFQTGNFTDVHCSGTSANNFCMASGQYLNSQGTFPLVAISTDSGTTWSYPSYIYSNLSTTIGNRFLSGSFDKSATAGATLKALLQKR